MSGHVGLVRLPISWNNVHPARSYSSWAFWQALLVPWIVASEPGWMRSIISLRGRWSQTLLPTWGCRHAGV